MKIEEINEDKLMACNEKIIWEIYKTLNNEIKMQIEEGEETKDPDCINLDLLECSILCEKLLTYDYFEESERYIDEAVKQYNKNFLSYERMMKKWTKINNKEVKRKQKDLRKLFDLIVKNSEAWC